MNSHVYVCKKPAYTEERNGRYLLIWDDIPNWMVVDEEACTFIKAIQGETTVEKIAKTFQSITKAPDTAVDAVIHMLKEAKILHEPGDPAQFLPERDKIMSVIVYPTNKCNLRCVMCYNKDNLLTPSDEKEELTIKEFKNFLDQVKPFLAEKKINLQILGGEPLLVPEKTLALTEYASPLFERISLSTNGTLITREFAQKITTIENAAVQVSLDSPHRKTHEAIRGKGTFDRTIRGIKILLEENVATVMNMVCTKKNVHELTQYYELALQLGVPRARFIPLQLAGAGITCGLEPPPYLQLIHEGFTLFEKNPQYRKLMGSDFLSTLARICHICAIQKWCGTGLRLVMLNADGTVYPCPNHHVPEFKAGNIRENSFKDIWVNSPVLKKIRSTYPVTSLNKKCASCPIRYWCVGGCRGETYQMTHSMREPSVMCDEIKQMIIDMFFRLSEDSGVFTNLKKEFGKSLSLDKI